MHEGILERANGVSSILLGNRAAGRFNAPANLFRTMFVIFNSLTSIPALFLRTSDQPNRLFVDIHVLLCRPFP